MHLKDFGTTGAVLVRGFHLVNQPAHLNHVDCKGYETELKKCTSKEPAGNCTSAIVMCQNNSGN